MTAGSMTVCSRRFRGCKSLMPRGLMVVTQGGIEPLRGRSVGRRPLAAASNPEWEHVYCAAVLAANTSMRGVEVKHVRRRNVDLEKVWDVESATGKGVLYVTRSKNETSKRPIPLNQAAKEAVERMLRRAETLGHTDPNHYL